MGVVGTGDIAGSIDMEPELEVPGPEQLLETIRKLILKRDKLDEAIVRLKQQHIKMIERL